MRSETLAVSMLDPPPTATNPSKSPSTAKFAAAWKESPVGSTRERSHTSTSMPSASINSTMRPVMFALTTPGSEASITLPTPIRFSSQPTSSEAPGPYFSGVASMVKIVSCPFPPSVIPLLPATGFHQFVPSDQYMPNPDQRQLGQAAEILVCALNT